MKLYPRLPLALLALSATVWFAGCKEESRVATPQPTEAPVTATAPTQPTPSPQATAEPKTPEAPTPAPANQTASREAEAATKAEPAPKEQTPAPVAAKAIVWGTDIEAAKQEAQKTGKKVLLFFHTEWCGYCKLMLNDTFPRSEVISFVTRNFIPVELDGDKEAALTREYRITGYPTTIVLTAQGEELGRIPGYLPSNAYISTLSDINRR